jgi:hypothetical protein
MPTLACPQLRLAQPPAMRHHYVPSSHPEKLSQITPLNPLVGPMSGGPDQRQRTGIDRVFTPIRSHRSTCTQSMIRAGSLTTSGQR